MYPADRKYSKDHEWVIIAGGEGRVGITDYAQKQLGDVVFLELPEVGRTLKAGEVFGSIEPEQWWWVHRRWKPWSVRKRAARTGSTDGQP